MIVDFIQDNDIDMSGKSTLEVQGSLQFDQISLETIRSLEKLSPYGMDNPKPHFLLRITRFEQARSMGKDNSHLKLKLVQKGTTFRCGFTLVMGQKSGI